MIDPEELWIVDNSGFVSGPFTNMEQVYAEAHSIKDDPNFQTKGRACIVKIVEVLDNFFSNDMPLEGEAAARKFADNFPDADINENCLEDIACAKCGTRDGFKIGFNGTCQVNDDGSDDVGDHEWDGVSSCVCTCGEGGTVDDFTIKGLDDLLRTLAAEREAAARASIVTRSCVWRQTRT